MGSTATTGELIWPTQNDVYGSGVGGSAGDGNKFLEAQARKRWGSVARRNNYMLTGGNLPSSDADLTITIPAGAAILEGHYCEWPATDITLPASNTSYIFIKLVYSGTLISGLEIEDNTSGTPPTSSLQLGTATTSGSAVTSTTDTRIFKNHVATLSSGTFKIPAGQYRAKVRVWGPGGGGASSGESFTPIDQEAGGSPAAASFGSLVSANGGSGGPFASMPINALSSKNGADATVGIGDLVLPGRGMPGGRGGVYWNGSATCQGGSGGAGAYAEKVIDVTPGDSYTITIPSGGAGGAGGGGTDNGEAGKDGKVSIEYV